MNFRHDPKKAILSSPEALRKLGLTADEVRKMPDSQLEKLVKQIKGDKWDVRKKQPKKRNA